MPLRCLKPFATRRPLYLSMMPAASFLILLIHLTGIGRSYSGASSNVQVPLACSDVIFSSMALFNRSASSPLNASSYIDGSSNFSVANAALYHSVSDRRSRNGYLLGVAVAPAAGCAAAPAAGCAADAGCAPSASAFSSCACR